MDAVSAIGAQALRVRADQRSILGDFPAAALAPFGLEAQHPDDFLLNQIDRDPIAALKSIKAMRARLRNPAISALDLATALERSQLPLVAARMREVHELI